MLALLTWETGKTKQQQKENSYGASAVQKWWELKRGNVSKQEWWCITKFEKWGKRRKKIVTEHWQIQGRWEEWKREESEEKTMEHQKQWKEWKYKGQWNINWSKLSWLLAGSFSRLALTELWDLDGGLLKVIHSLKYRRPFKSDT